MQTQDKKFNWFKCQVYDAARSLAPMLLLTGLAFGHAVAQAQGQPVYRIVGTDGKVTFSDKPPLAASGKSTPTVNLVSPGQAEQTNLPLEVRQVVAKFPVTLYVSVNCTPCDSGRNFLSNRGVPFTERTVSTAEDGEAFQKLSGNASLPLLTIGGQHISGFLATEWASYLSAAGYPEQSKLPAGYRRAPATALVSVQKPAASEAAKAAAPAPVAVSLDPAPAPNPNNPAGIQF